MHSKFGLSYTQDGLMILFLTVSSSITQPVFGRLADRGTHRLLLPFSVSVAGLGLAASALAPTYPIALIAIFLSGLGVAAYHPEASRLASALSGPQRGTGMSLFSVGGNIGFALGAGLGGLIASQFGLDGGWLLVVPAVIGATLIAVRLPHAPAPDARGGRGDRPLRRRPPLADAAARRALPARLRELRDARVHPALRGAGARPLGRLRRAPDRAAPARRRADDAGRRPDGRPHRPAPDDGAAVGAGRAAGAPVPARRLAARRGSRWSSAARA